MQAVLPVYNATAQVPVPPSRVITKYPGLYTHTGAETITNPGVSLIVDGEDTERESCVSGALDALISALLVS